MAEAIQNIPNIFEINFRFVDFLDMAIVAFVMYKGLNFVHKTRAEQLLKGLILMLVVMFFADFLKMYSISWILSGLLGYGVIAAVVVFQPELRRILEYMGRTKFGRFPVRNQSRENAKDLVSEITESIDYLSQTKTGAIIVIEGRTALGDYVETGTRLDAEISIEMIKNIFYKNAPLHDGAVIVAEERILSAGCFLPLSKTKRLSKDVGTRHRAALGITEISDATAIVISEETGGISIAEEGNLDRFLKLKEVEKKLYDIYLPNVDGKQKGFAGLKNAMFGERENGKQKNAKK
jgi:diadenylate cyclase